MGASRGHKLRQQQRGRRGCRRRLGENVSRRGRRAVAAVAPRPYHIRQVVHRLRLCAVGHHRWLCNWKQSRGRLLCRRVVRAGGRSSVSIPSTAGPRRQLRRPWRPRRGCRCHRFRSSSRGRPRRYCLALARRRQTHGISARASRRHRHRRASAALGACSRREGLGLCLAEDLVLPVVSGALLGRGGHNLPAGSAHGGRVGWENIGRGTAPAAQMGAGEPANKGG